MPSVVKKIASRELTESFKDAEGLVILGVNGLDMPENETLRGQLAEHGVRLRMVPNKIARRVLGDRGLEFPEGVFSGSTAVAAGDAEQTILAAKVVTSSPLRKSGKLTLRAGALEGIVLGESDAAALADVPDRDTLRSKILGCLSGPAQQIALLVNAPQSALARVLQAKIDADGGAGEEGGDA
ncbi:50S ribosomal protein L10 [Engelhardtia mirabilis]|uniref:Large ribosomal subunit protein uL10 n=1 Tax=Engelhardtia mirabilis TaxID=2528011 RepID=A0A518BPF1_9BACT|nr:50S ribosomal protein L10 [Planctomycetes bacterium Pla133]QDV03175.1 50S ribosomal protein L10 [Planctomycetes bacterium Pla86]